MHFRKVLGTSQLLVRARKYLVGYDHGETRKQHKKNMQIRTFTRVKAKRRLKISKMRYKAWSI